MEDPFFPSFWRSARPSHRSPPQPKTTTAPAMTRPSRTTKVVPVHFVGSDEEAKRPVAVPTAAASGAMESAKTAAAAAARIQRVFRAFLVRKNFRVVRQLEAEVDAVERGMEENRELLRRDGRERLRVNETLMSVLFRLDSVRGLRDYRRRVIRRAIALQEAVDTIAVGEGVGAGEESSVSACNGGDDEAVEEEEAPDQTLGCPGLMEETLENQGQTPSSTSGEERGETEHGAEEPNGDADMEEGDPREEGTAMDAIKTPHLTNTVAETLELEDGTKREASAAEPTGETPGETTEETKAGEESPTPGERWVTSDDSDSTPSPATLDRAATGEGVLGEGDKSMKEEVMERLVKENQSLKGLMAELLERNEMQCRLMGGMLERVENLERTAERMGRKKKKRPAGDSKKAARNCQRKL